MNQPVLRIARVTGNPQGLAEMYCRGLNFEILGSFSDHDGFDGTMIGHPNAPWHLEFTAQAGHAAPPSISAENLLVFYLPEKKEWEMACHQMEAAGFKKVRSENPYWDKNGMTFEDPERYRVVLQNTASPV